MAGTNFHWPFLIVRGLFLRNIVNNNKNKQVSPNSFLFFSVVSVHKYFDEKCLSIFLSCDDEGQSLFFENSRERAVERRYCNYMNDET